MTLKTNSMSTYTRKFKIILVPYPAQGHVTPMLKLAFAFVNLGFQPMLVVPEFIHHRISPQIDPEDGISCISIPDGLDEATPRDFFAIEMAMENHMPFHLESFVSKLVEEDGNGVACMIVDLLASYAINVACRCGVQVAGFWPVMLGVYRLIAAIPDMLRSGIVSEADDVVTRDPILLVGFPLQEGDICVVPGEPMIDAQDLPWLIGTTSARNARFKFWTRTLDRSKPLHYILVNSSSDNDNDLIDHAEDQLHQDHNSPLILPVGPLNLHASASTKKASFWEEDLTCLDWLDRQPTGSVVYVSFGSWVSPIGEAKVKSLALALEATNRPFIWVVGHAWREGLPKDYLARVSKQAKIVSWAPQEQVLQHKAVGCYLTHCGWNSTVEAIQCMKPLLCYPVAGDQFLNCAYIVKTWRIGVRLNGFGAKDLQDCLESVTEDNEMSHRIVRLNERIMGKDACSLALNNLRDFVRGLENCSSITSGGARTQGLAGAH